MSIKELINLLESFKDKSRDVLIYMKREGKFEEIGTIVGAVDSIEYIRLEVGAVDDSEP